MKKYLSLLLALLMVSMAFTVVGAVSGTKDVTRNNIYPADGSYDQYYVYRSNTSRNAYLNITYTGNSNTVRITMVNIKKIVIDSNSLYENHSSDLWNNMSTFSQMQYFWIHNGPYKMIINAGSLEEFILQDIGIEPYKIKINSRAINYNYASEDLTVNITSYNMTGQKNIYVYFQSLSESIIDIVYEWIPIIITLFMVGIALSLLFRKNIFKSR